MVKEPGGSGEDSGAKELSGLIGENDGKDR